MATRDREVLALLDTTAPADVREQVVGLVASLGSEPEEVERLHAGYAWMDGLKHTEPDDPAVETAAAAIVDGLPDRLLRTMAERGWAEDFDLEDNGLLNALCASLAPAQAEALRRALRRIAGRAERLS